MTLFRTLARHLAGIITGWVVTFITALGMGVTGDEIANIEATVLILLMAVFTFAWTLVEKALKPLWVKHFGERQPDKPEDPNPYLRMILFLILVPVAFAACNGDNGEHRGGGAGTDTVVTDTTGGGGALNGSVDLDDPIDDQ